METLAFNDSGTLTFTLPRPLKEKFGLNKPGRRLVTIEERDGGILLTPGESLTIEGREFSQETIDRWMALDQKGMNEFLATASTP